MSDPFRDAQHSTSEYENLDVRLRVGPSRLHIRAQMPRDPISLPEILPVLQSLTDALVAVAVREIDRTGRRVSCGPGCGACCRQLVPVGEIEALYLRDLLNGMDSSRRGRIEERFRDAVQELSNAGLLDELSAADGLAGRDARRDLAYRYFRLGIPCPFLENESCSIHPQRPLACREYLVTSPSAKCVHLESGGVETLQLPRRPSATLYRFGDGVGAVPPRWLPLTLILEGDRSCDAGMRQRKVTAPLLFERFLQELTKAKSRETTFPEISHS
jgi:Fe-S-cluster containining protein